MFGYLGYREGVGEGAEPVFRQLVFHQDQGEGEEGEEGGLRERERERERENSQIVDYLNQAHKSHTMGKFAQLSQLTIY